MNRKQKYEIDYGKLILELRAKLDITQEELADMLNIVFATVNRWENNRIVPSKRHALQIEKLCKENGIKIE